MLSLESIESVLARYPGSGHYLVAYSGGLDSTVLLDLCARLKARGTIDSVAAVHVNHGLQAESAGWAAHCLAICRTLAIPCHILSVDASARVGESPEEAARRARYEALRHIVSEDEVVLTAQHRDDQLETILLQLFRGAGLPGLSGMAPCASLGKGWLARPLLDCSRTMLHRYAVGRGLRWIEDDSNRDTAFDRNFLRHEILPRLESRWPALAATVQRSGRHCAEAQSLLNRLIEARYQALRHPRRNTLRIAGLLGCDISTQRLILRRWIGEQRRRNPSAAVIERVQTELIGAGADKSPRVAWSEGEIRRYRDELYCLAALPAVDRCVRYHWDGSEPLPLPGGRLTASAGSGSDGIDHKSWTEGVITVRFRRGGERCRLRGRVGRHTLKKLYQERGVPPWVRERLPLVYINGALAAVGDLWVCEPFAAAAGDGCIRLHWQCSGLGWGPHNTHE